MKFENILFYVLLILFSGNSIAGDDLASNRLCGKLVNYDENPCSHIKEVDFVINKRDSIYGGVINDLKLKTIIELNVFKNKFKDKKIKFNIGRPISVKNRKSETVLSVLLTVFLNENGENMDVIFTTSSKYSYTVDLYKCNAIRDIENCINSAFESYLLSKIYQDLSGTKS